MPAFKNFLIGALLAGAATAPALAQQTSRPPATSDEGVQDDKGVQDIVVTASKTGTATVQHTPIAVSAFSADALGASHITNTKDLAQFVPNLSVAQFSTYAQIYIRGVGSNNSFNGSDPSVTVHSDGVYIARPFAQFTSFLDVDRVEVLRGPQGTLYGRNSAGGTINIVSRVPTDSFAARGTLETGNYGLLNVGGFISGAIVPGTVQATLAGSFTRHGPYRRNIVASGNNFDDDNSRSLRGQVRVHLTPNLEATTRGDYALAKPRIAGFSVLTSPYDAVTTPIVGDYHRVALDFPQFSRTKIWGVSEDVQLHIGSSTTLKSLTAYRDSRSTSQQDGDSSDQKILEVNLGEVAKQFTQEFNLVGTGRVLDYVVGLFYFNERAQTDSVVALPARNVETFTKPFNHTEAYAGYAQGTVHISDKLSLIVGGRYSREDKHFDQYLEGHVYTTTALTSTTRYSRVGNYNFFTPKAGVNWTPTDHVLVYASVTRGFKSGGFNFNSANPAQGFGPENLWAYEGGAKVRLLDNRLALNVAAFDYDYRKLQVNSFISPGVTDIVNAASAHVRGVELEATARPVKPLNLTANFAFLDAKYDSFKQAAIGGGVTVDATGNRLNNAPQFSMNLAGQYDLALPGGHTAYIRGEFSHRSRAFFTAGNNPLASQPGFELVNAAIGFRPVGGHLTLEVWGRNLADTQYISNAYTSSPVPSGIPGAPRTVGVRLGYSY